MSSLQNAFSKAVAVINDQRGKPAILGKSDGTLYWVDPNGMTHRTRVWARIGEQASNQEVVVDCLRASPQMDMPVRVDHVNGRLTVVDVDGQRAIEFGGGRPGATVSAHAWLHNRLGPDPVYIEGLQLLPLLVTPTSPPDLTVKVQGGAYTDSAGDLAIHDTAVSGSFSAFVPGTGHHFVIVCLDRTDGSIVLVDGSDVTVTDALFGDAVVTAADIEAVVISGDYKPLGAVLLYAAQTQIKARDIIKDLRTDSAAGSGLPAGTDGQIQYNNGGAFGGSGAYWDDVNGRLGIGTASPSFPIHSVKDGDNNSGFENYSDVASQGSVHILRRARGTITSPGTVQSGDRLGGFAFGGYVSGFQNTALLTGEVSENWSGSARGTSLSFETTANGTTSRTQKMWLQSGLVIGSPSGGDPGAGAIGIDAHINLDEMAATPASPTAGTMCNLYMKADKLVIQYNDGGTVRFKSLDLTGTGVTWVHGTTPP